VTYDVHLTNRTGVHFALNHNTISIHLHKLWRPTQIHKTTRHLHMTGHTERSD